MEKFVKHMRIVAVIIALSILSFSVCGEAADSTIKIGLIAPLSGANAQGMYQIAGAEMAIKEINAAGGIAGKVKIEGFVEDDEGNPANSVSVAQKLIAQTGVNVIVGAQNSSCTLAIMPLTESNKIPHIAPSSTAAAITKQGNKYIFRLAVPDMVYAETIIKYLQGWGYKSGAILHDSSDFGLSGYTCVTEVAAKLKFNIVASEVYTTGDRDFSTQLTTIKQKKPDVIIPWGYFTEAALIAQQMKQYEVKSVICGFGFESDQLAELGGEAVEGVIAATAFTRDSKNQLVQDFITKFESENNMKCTREVVSGYDAIYAVAAAVEAAGAIDGEAVCNQLHTLQFSGLGSDFSFDEHGEVQKIAFMAIVKNGKFTSLD
jgi:branched-chain amino acid transport system substrate-binding protein